MQGIGYQSDFERPVALARAIREVVDNSFEDRDFDAYIGVEDDSVHAA